MTETERGASSPTPLDPSVPGALSEGGHGGSPQRICRFWARVPGILVSVALLAGITIFSTAVNHHYAIADWLVWRYAGYLALAAVWGVSCLGFGFFVLDRVRGERPGRGASGASRLDDGSLPGKAGGVLWDSVLAFPLGVFSFQLAVFVLGLVHALGTVTFVLLPAAFALAGLPRLFQLGRALRRLRPPRTFWDLGVLLFGLGGLGLLYFQILSPESIHWDARWYHLPVARQYALWGAVRPFAEGWWIGTNPQGASLAYTWAFLWPNSLLFDRLELCLHMELMVFVATILSLPALVRALAPGVGGRAAWVAMFLFPGIFLYESNLAGAADHFAALLCVPLILALIQVWSAFTARNAILFAVFVAAVVNSKVLAWCMLVPAFALFGARTLWLLVSPKAAAGGRQGVSPGGGRVSIVRAALLALGTVLVLSASFWAKNWLWYGDPMYPRLHAHLPVHPWNPEAEASLAVNDGFNFRARPGLPGVLDALLSTVTFSFIPNDWPTYHRDVPVFGSLFTLTMLALLFMRPRARAAHWLTYVGAMVATFVWYMVSHQDRYLQVWLPGMAAATAATIGLLWKNGGLLVRTLTTTLVALQVLWGGDVPFFPTHNLIRDSPIRETARFLASGFMRTPNRFRLFGDEGLVNALLPRDANALLHELNPQIGIDVLTVSDQWQGRLSYATLGSPAAIHRALAELKITHVVWDPHGFAAWNSVGNALAFLNFAANYTVDQVEAGQYRVGRFVPDRPPAAAFDDRVAYLACGNSFLHHLASLRDLAPGVDKGGPIQPITDEPSAVATTNLLIVDPACHPKLPDEVGTAFQPPVPWDNRLHLYVRRLRP